MTRENYRRTDVHAERKTAEREAAREATKRLVDDQPRPEFKNAKRILYVVTP